MKCKACQRTVSAVDLFCPDCGEWLSSPRPFCECMRNNEAVGVCVVCGTPVCATCGHVEGNVSFCREVAHRTIWRTHELVAHLDSIFEGDWMSANLRLQNIDAKVFSTREHAGLYGLTIPSDVRVYVPRERAEQASQVIRSFTTAESTE